jgi:hypothetical protein
MKAVRRSDPKGEPVCGLSGFLSILNEMEDGGETKREISGDYAGPFFSKAAYACVIRMGFDL